METDECNIEAGPSQRGASIGLGTRSLREVNTPGVKRSDAEVAAAGEEVLLEKGPAKAYRGLAALANFMAQDAPDIGFAAKEISKSMSGPRWSDIPQLKRLGRYLTKHPTRVYIYIYISGKIDRERFAATAIPTGEATGERDDRRLEDV